MKYHWMQLSDGLEFELMQARDEGRALTPEIEAEIAQILALEDTNEKNARAAAAFDKVQALAYAAGENAEPDALFEIQALSGGNPPLPKADRDGLFNHVYGAWLGRAAGCLLGKPVEGWRTPQLNEFLKRTDNFPLNRYMRGDVPEETVQAVARVCGHDSITGNRAFINRVDGMPEDDDTNYTLIGLKLIETCGRDFSPEQAAQCWLGNLPIYHVFTAERVAYRNLVMGIAPPESAHRANPYREWIGAQIRADMFGYVNPASPREAAAMAWRDASISHVKNGIYGEMWVAAMLAAAAVTRDMEAVIRAGLREIPSGCRLSRAIEDVIGWRREGASWESARQKIHARWDEFSGHHWCHTISNAQIVAGALLFGENDLEKTLCRAVSAGFDTDCNGATAGSVLGMALGADKLPDKWISPLRDTLFSGVDGFGRVKISDMALRTVALIP